MLLSLVTLFVGLLIGSFGYDLLDQLRERPRRATPSSRTGSPSRLADRRVRLSAGVYYLLTNVEHSFRDVLPGAVVAAVVLEASFQVLPLYVRFSAQLSR